ncbi:mRNA-decapping enzyme 1B isoform X3 [Bombyx mandarina]|uniref:mRNA-decapping enzyme C-terminal domain-containing protein n=2 Tax=Bombyx TaxID=7090 RepID=A0A8R1WIW8_BOMMO|nr:mRNA-decapping enzyme 1B isoform X1 [Bombyx mori]XP_028032718.1 mRNA-decapping enzyme 1B isoform X2 [Bombyx mandarina]XP_028032719.1 mRNA-decapping enzyme 1B isoform X3 [Bombyx mandarina]
MADTGLRSMNFAALKRADPYAREIVDSATHVALYTFEENEWEKTNIEGALFVYSRNGEPYHSLVIMNRLNTNNLIEPVSKGIELQLKEPFLLYRNAKCRIYGIWFYDKDECVRVATKLNTLVKESIKQSQGETMPQNSVYNSSTTSTQSIDIFSMLSKAQDDFNSNKGVAGNKSESTPAKAPDMTSQSVMDFFAKAGSGASAQMPAVSSLPSPGIFGPRATDSREVPQLLQRLMSNPAHSVEHIEKQQRSVTPQEGQSSNGNSTLDSGIKPNCMFSLKSTPLEKQNQRIPGLKKALDSSDANGIVTMENELNLMHLSSPKTTSPLAAYLNQSQDIGHTQKPALMPPTMFTASSGGDVQPSPQPLTRNQLLQAFNYLLKHDADFVNKLHEAYVKSFSEKAFSVS